MQGSQCDQQSQKSFRLLPGVAGMVGALLVVFSASCSNASFKAANGVRAPGGSQDLPGDLPGTNGTTSGGSGNGGGGSHDPTLPCYGVTQLSLPGITKTGPNMVPNGDFENGYEGFTSDYAFNDMSSCVNSDSLIPGIGQFGILENPQHCHRAWDEFSGESKVAVFNGAVGQNFWCKTFTVEPDRSYAFAVNERLLHEDRGISSTNGSSPLRWTIDGEEVIPASSPERRWRTRGAVWSSGARTSIEVCGKNGSANNSGNDWAIDNICLVPQ